MLKKKLDLQLFATTEVDLKSDATTTYAGVKTIDDAHAYFDRALKDAIYDEYTFEKYADTITLPQNNGKTMTLRKLTKYDAKINELKEGVVPPEDAPMGINEFSVRLGDYGGYTTYTDQVDIYALNNGVAARIQRNQGNSVGEKFQYKVRDIMYSSPNRWFAGVTTVPATLAEFEKCKPLYVTLPGWKEDITNVTSFDELPDAAKNYIKKVEELTSCKVAMFSVGPERKQTIKLVDLFSVSSK